MEAKITYTTRDLAARYNVSQRTIQRWIVRGYIQARKTGPAQQSNYIIAQDAVDYLDNVLNNTPEIGEPRAA